jgi:type II secretory pathway component PulF
MWAVEANRSRDHGSDENSSEEFMPRFSYKAINEIGTTVTGAVEADSIQRARELIGEKGLIPSSISPASKKTSSQTGLTLKERLTKVSIPELILFTKQFRTMLRAGVSIVRIFEILSQQSDNARLKKAATMMAQNMKEGTSMYDTFKSQPTIFDGLYCSMIQAGEASGALPEVLDRLTYLIEHEHEVKSKIRSALQYPIIVIVFLGIAFFILLTFVIPKFISIFESAKIDLPLPTVICNIMYHLLVSYWYILISVLAALILGLRFYFKTENGRLTRDAFLLKLPLFGPLFVKAAMSRFASIFSILQSSGIGVLDAMEILSGTIGNYSISRQFERIHKRLEEGLGISGPLRSAKYFPPMVINMVAIGEESGNLDEMLLAVSNHYDQEVEYATGRLSELIGPILIVGLAAVVGFFALAIFLPMWDLTQMVR